MSSIANKVGAGGRERYRSCLYEYTEAETERERGGVCWEGGKWGRWCALEEEEAEEEGCSAAVERSERRLQSLLMGEIRPR